MRPSMGCPVMTLAIGDGMVIIDVSLDTELFESLQLYSKDRLEIAEILGTGLCRLSLWRSVQLFSADGLEMAGHLAYSGKDCMDIVQVSRNRAL